MKILIYKLLMIFLFAVGAGLIRHIDDKPLLATGVICCVLAGVFLAKFEIALKDKAVEDYEAGMKELYKRSKPVESQS